MKTLSDQIKSSLSSSPHKVDLVEEGGYQSARATSPNRIEQIAEAVARGLAEEDADVIRRRRLLIMFGELDDDEIALLNAYGRSYAGADRRAFDNVNRPEPVALGSGPETVERNRLYEVGKEHLLRLELLRRNYGSVKRGQLPEFDPRLGDFKHRVEISQLGRMLLKEIGMPTPFDEARERRAEPSGMFGNDA